MKIWTAIVAYTTELTVALGSPLMTLARMWLSASMPCLLAKHLGIVQLSSTLLKQHHEFITRGP